MTLPYGHEAHGFIMQIQGELGEGHMNIVQASEVVLTSSHLALILEYAAGGTLTKYVSDRWDTVHQRGGLFLEEHEALFFFKVLNWCQLNSQTRCLGSSCFGFNAMDSMCTFGGLD